MRDGVRIAVELWLPPSAEDGEKFPAIVWFTRYWRAGMESQAGGNHSPRLGDLMNAAGYVFAHVDARGSGASFGQRFVEYPDEEVRDAGEIIEWLSAQTWSNGRIGTDGISYTGNTAELAAASNHGALKAATPRFTDFDNYAQIHFPGGLQSTAYLKDWGIFVKALDRNDIETLHAIDNMPTYKAMLGVKPVDNDPDQALLRECIKDHVHNVYFVDHGRNWLFRDDLAGITPDGERIARRPLFTYRDEIESAQIPMMHWAGWLDSGTADGALARFATFKAPNLTIIGPWNHGAITSANVFAAEPGPPVPSIQEQWQQVFSFFEPYLKNGTAAPIMRVVRYFTMGRDEWHTTDVWPPRGITYKPWYCSNHEQLDVQPQTELGSEDRYAIDFEAASGKTTRWSTSMGGTPVDYGDRTTADALLLCYTSSPLKSPLEITGHPVVTLYVSSTHTDGAFIVYLESVAPSGRVTYLTEGMLRAIHRKISDAPPYENFGPYHSFLRQHAMPLVPGEVAELSFKLFPTSVEVPAGHALRIAIAGHDKDTFVRVPETGSPLIQLHRGGACPSRIELPIRQA